MSDPLHGIPKIGLGTFNRRGPEGIDAIETALAVGFRHLDTAQDYETERECITAVRNMGLKREEVFITTKVSTANLGPGQVAPSLERSLEALQSDSVDLALIHWPAKYDEYAVEDYVAQLAECAERGMATRIGVSNFPIAHLERALAVTGPGVIRNNQVEIHPFLQNRKLRAFCADADIAMTCYMPLASGAVHGDPVLTEIGEGLGATPGQVALAFLMQSGMIVIPSSTSRAHLEENFAATELTLDAATMARIEALDCGRRIIERDWGPRFD